MKGTQSFKLRNLVLSCNYLLSYRLWTIDIWSFKKDVLLKLFLYAKMLPFWKHRTYCLNSSYTTHAYLNLRSRKNCVKSFRAFFMSFYCENISYFLKFCEKFRYSLGNFLCLIEMASAIFILTLNLSFCNLDILHILFWGHTKIECLLPDSETL